MDFTFTTGNSGAYKCQEQMAIVGWQISPVRGTGIIGKLQKIGHTKADCSVVDPVKYDA
jgi:hypothetical protein